MFSLVEAKEGSDLDMWILERRTEVMTDLLCLY
jgi:hypothetical protein